MTNSPNDERERVLRHIADRRTTRSFKRTLNTAILLRAAHSPGTWSAIPRKVRRWAAFLGLAGLFVSEHEKLLRLLINHF
jgi:hypothetical protein